MEVPIFTAQIIDLGGYKIHAGVVKIWRNVTVMLDCF